MLDQPPLWLVLIAFLCALGPLVFFHELGHYLVGRWFGVAAEVFSIGFGPELIGWNDRRGTRWKIAWLPLGGYVKFVGDMNPASAAVSTDVAPELADQSFQTKPVWQRFLIVLAGPFANFLIAILIFASFFAWFGVPRTPAVVDAVRPGSTAAQIGLRHGDRISAIDGESVGRFEDMQRIVSLRPGETVIVDIVRQGRSLSSPARLGVTEQKDRFGQTFRVGMLGVLGTQPVVERVALVEVVPEAARYTAAITRSMVDGLVQVITGRRSTKDLGGTIKMAQIAGQQASLGPFEFIQLLALFSINLGFINLLPVPLLDGGHLFFYVVEAVRRRPVSARVFEWSFRGGLAAIVALLVFTTVNDLGSLGLWERLQRLIG